MFVTTIISSIYLYIIFRKDIKVKINKKELKEIKPKNYIKNKGMLFSSIFVLSVVIFLIVFKEYIFEYF
jgi:Na+/H+ antiporter NhaD/arsenite permease-like protein